MKTLFWLTLVAVTVVYFSLIGAAAQSTEEVIYFDKSGIIKTSEGDKDPLSGPGRDMNTVYVTADGRVGIGVAAPADKLSVAGVISATDSILVEGGRLVGGDFRGFYLNGVINCGGAYRTYTNTLSDLTDPNPSFAVGDEDLYIQDVLEVGTQAYKPGGGSWTTLSDKRYKEKIEPFTDGLSSILQIRPVSFEYNERAGVFDLEKRYIGVLAQDMLAIAPYMVEEVPIGQVVREIENGVDEILEPGTMAYTFDPSALDYMMINAIQELQQMIESQNQRIEALEQENVTLKGEVEKLRGQDFSFRNDISH